MASYFFYKDKEVALNNRQFASLISLVLEIADVTAEDADEVQSVTRLKGLMEDGYFWPGRGVQIEDDFPDTEEQKFWARVFLDTARAVFDRRIGNHEHAFWQAQCIHQAYGAGLLFIEAVRSQEPRWLPESTDFREFDLVVNGERRARNKSETRH